MAVRRNRIIAKAQSPISAREITVLITLGIIFIFPSGVRNSHREVHISSFKLPILMSCVDDHVARAKDYLIVTREDTTRSDRNDHGRRAPTDIETTRNRFIFNCTSQHRLDADGMVFALAYATSHLLYRKELRNVLSSNGTSSRTGTIIEGCGICPVYLRFTNMLQRYHP